jgi:CDP-diacylglycerol--glycerol-3-phosphate 3-phosphatidyltransferase
MTLANKVTIARILLIPVFVVEVLYYRQTGADWHRWFALGVFAAAALSDGVDGWIARRFKQRSRLGALLDPLADKLLLVAALILLSHSGFPHVPALPLWLVASVLSRDAILILGLAVIYFTCGHLTVRPHFTGKAATVLQMSVVILALLDVWPQTRWWVALLAAAATVVSGLIYIRVGVQQLSASPQSGPERME